MADLDLTQAEADGLIAMEKVKVTEAEWEYPTAGNGVAIPLTSRDRREAFFLDIHRSRLNLVKGTYQNRARHAVVLVRLDFGGPPHRNPDEQEVLCPHLHLYREGFGDKWAVPAPTDKFSHLQDRWQTLDDFMGFCNVVDRPAIRRGLFI